MNFSTCSWSWAGRTVTDGSGRAEIGARRLSTEHSPVAAAVEINVCGDVLCKPAPSILSSLTGCSTRVWKQTQSLGWKFFPELRLRAEQGHSSPKPSDPRALLRDRFAACRNQGWFCTKSTEFTPDSSLPLRTAAHIRWRRMWMLLVLVQEQGEQSNTSSHWWLLLSFLSRDSTRTPGMSPWAPRPWGGSPGTRLPITPDTSGDENWPRSLITAACQPGCLIPAWQTRVQQGLAHLSSVLLMHYSANASCCLLLAGN